MEATLWAAVLSEEEGIYSPLFVFSPSFRFVDPVLIV